MGSCEEKKWVICKYAWGIGVKLNLFSIFFEVFLLLSEMAFNLGTRIFYMFRCEQGKCVIQEKMRWSDVKIIWVVWLGLLPSGWAFAKWQNWQVGACCSASLRFVSALRTLSGWYLIAIAICLVEKSPKNKNIRDFF